MVIHFFRKSVKSNNVIVIVEYCLIQEEPHFQQKFLPKMRLHLI